MPFIPIKNTGDFYTMVEVAELLGINSKTLHSRIRVGTFPGPSHQPLGSVRKYYTREDMDRFKLAAGKEAVQ